jgi:hypothetical protein
MEKILKKLLNWISNPIADGNITGVAYTVTPPKVNSLNDFFEERKETIQKL